MAEFTAVSIFNASKMLIRYRHVADLERLAYYAQLDIEIARYQ